MPKITSFTKQNISLVRPALEAALSQIKRDFGVEISIGTIRYDSNTIGTKVTITTEKGIEAKQEFSNKGTKFILKGVTYTVTEYKPRNFKYPYIAVNSRGTSYKFTAITVNANKITK